MIAKKCAAGSSNGKMRPAKSCSNVASASRSNASRRLPLGRISTPYKISAIVIVVVKRLSGGCPDIQATTAAEGTGFVSSDTTLVSRTINIRYSIPGSRIGSRGNGSKSTPPSGANRRRIAWARFNRFSGAVFNALFRISRASCSMDRPCIAARILSFRLVASSSFRMIMLAMQSMIALQSMIAKSQEPWRFRKSP